MKYIILILILILTLAAAKVFALSQELEDKIGTVDIIIGYKGKLEPNPALINGKIYKQIFTGDIIVMSKIPELTEKETEELRKEIGLKNDEQTFALTEKNK